MRSAGLLLYRLHPDLEVLLAHPGGPFWAKKEEGAWMIPKGLIEPDEAPLAAALREFEEEMGGRPQGEPWPLATIRQKGGKWVEAFALEGEFDPTSLSSNMFKVEWPPRSGRWQSYAEVDRAAWFELPAAYRMILPSQAPLLDALEEKLV